MKKSAITLLLLPMLLATACGSGFSDAGLASLDQEAASGDQGIASLDGSEEAAPSDDAGGAEVDAEEAMLAFTECLRSEGIDVQDPEFDEDGNFRFRSIREGVVDLDPEAFREAREACAEELEGVATRFRDVDRTEVEDRLFEYADCMRQNGYEMPDPDFGEFGGGPGTGDGEGPRGPFGDIDREDPQFQAAAEACSHIFEGGFGPGAGPAPEGG
jgi:hypothetical protein